MVVSQGVGPSRVTTRSPSNRKQVCSTNARKSDTGTEAMESEHSNHPEARQPTSSLGQYIWGAMNELSDFQDNRMQVSLTRLDRIRQRVNTLFENLEVRPVRLELPPSFPTRSHVAFPSIDPIRDRPQEVKRANNARRGS